MQPELPIQMVNAGSTIYPRSPKCSIWRYSLYTLQYTSVGHCARCCISWTRCGYTQNVLQVHASSIAARNINTEKTTVYTLCIYTHKHTRLVKYELNEAKTLPEEQSSVCASAWQFYTISLPLCIGRVTARFALLLMAFTQFMVIQLKSLCNERDEVMSGYAQVWVNRRKSKGLHTTCSFHYLTEQCLLAG